MIKKQHSLTLQCKLKLCCNRCTAEFISGIKKKTFVRGNEVHNESSQWPAICETYYLNRSNEALESNSFVGLLLTSFTE